MDEDQLPEAFHNVRLPVSGNSLAKAEGVKFTKIENGRALCELQAGTYRFESQLEKKQR
jgi:hypothetical protein